MMFHLRSIILIFFVFFESIDSNHHLQSLGSLQIDPNHYGKSDLILYDFREKFQSNRCLLQTESKYFYLDSSCQLFTRASLKQICPLNYTLKIEAVFPEKTNVYEFTVELRYSQPLKFNVSKTQTILQLPFRCEETNEIKFNSKMKEIFIGNAHLLIQEQSEEKTCQFEKNPYRVKLNENELYKNFLQIKTSSSCSSANLILASSNSKRNFDFFNIDSSTGYLSLIRPLDYESITNWKLVIQGQDQYHIPFYTYVIIDVEDINDCAPLLSWNFPLQTIDILNDTDPFHISIAIRESKVEQVNVVIANLIASDQDALVFTDEMAKFELKFNSSSSLPFNILGPFADSTFVLSTNEQLDREKQEKYRLNLILTDQGEPRLSSFYQLDIQLLDDNDNPPKFDQSIYFAEIEENQSINTTLLRVHANDPDQDDNGRVSYALTDKHNRYVYIDSQTGIVRTKISFDYEEVRNFTFNITAMDHPKHGRPLKSTSTVFVNIIDQNDNIPKFIQSTYEFSIYENNSPNTLIGQMLAFDAENSQLTYTIDAPSDEISSLFRLTQNSGQIYALSPLDRERRDRYTFFVIASDGVHQSSQVKVVVHVLDLNDEIPRFIFPSANNDTLIIDRTYWNDKDYICHIEIQDLDQVPNHTLTLIDRLEQLKNFDYIGGSQTDFQFDSSKFYLNRHGKLFFNQTNETILDEGVYYLAFKLVDGQSYFDEKLLKLIVVNNYDRVQYVIKQFDRLGTHLNNRLSYLNFHGNEIHGRQKNPTHPSLSAAAALDQSNKFLVFIVITVLSIILVGITFIFISLIRRKSIQQKDFMKKQDSISTSSSHPPPSDSSTMNLFKPTLNSHEKRQSLRVSNCYEYNEITSPSSLLMLNKESVGQNSCSNDNSCLLETMTDKDIYDEQRNKTYSSWALSTANRQETRYSHRNNDSTFHSLNRLSIPPQMQSNNNLSHQLCSPKRHSTMTYDSSLATSTSTTSNIPTSSSPHDYTVAIVSGSTNNSPHTPVSSDDGFCGSSDISDPPVTNNSHHTLSSSHQHHSYRPQPYTMMKEGILQKSQRSPSFTALFNRLHESPTSINGNDTTRRVRFNLEPDDKSQRTILPLPTSNSPGRLADHALRRFEQLYMSRDDTLDKQSVDSSILYTNSTVV